MVKTLKIYDPLLPVSDVSPGGGSIPAGQGRIQIAVRVLTRKNEIIIDFDQLADILSWSDSSSIEGSSGSFVLRMKANRLNSRLLRQLHPGMVLEFYAARNDDPLKGVERNPLQANQQVLGLPSQIDPFPFKDDFASLETFDPRTLISPGRDYLDESPYLLLRGIISHYGQDGSPTDGADTLTISGSTYGRIYQTAQVHVDFSSPELTSVAADIRKSTEQIKSLVPFYYGLLGNWVEGFWGTPTGWEARTRPIPDMPNPAMRMNPGSVWSQLQSISFSGLFHLFVDHTGAIVWEKMPYSDKDCSYIPGRDWVDLPMVNMPSWKIVSWGSRLSEQGIYNLIRVQYTAIVGTQSQWGGYAYNTGSIKQYGPRKLELYYPYGRGTIFSQSDDALRKAQERANKITDLAVLEAIKWYDRPVPRVSATVRGEACWRLNVRVELAENWSHPDAKPGQYLIVGRTNTIDIRSGSWMSQLDLVGDRRRRYQGIGDRASSDVVNFNSQTDVPLENDDYWFYNRYQQPNSVINIGVDPCAKAKEIDALGPVDPPNLSVPGSETLTQDGSTYTDGAEASFAGGGTLLGSGSQPLGIAGVFKDQLPSSARHFPVRSKVFGTITIFEGWMADPGASKVHAQKRGRRVIGSTGQIIQIPPGPYNLGIDYGVTEAGNPIRAWFGGVVEFIRFNGGGYGNWLGILTNVRFVFEGKPYPVHTHYAHCAKISVKERQTVKQGEVVAIMGSTGRSTGPHVDFRLWIEVAGEDIEINPSYLDSQLAAGVSSQYATGDPNLSPEAAAYRALLAEPRVAAFLDIIAYVEVGTLGPEGYKSRYPATTFSSFDDHPRTVLCANIGSERVCSNAAGRYQFRSIEWDEAKKAIKLSSQFNPGNQDIACVWLIEQRGGLKLVRDGKVKEAIAKLNGTWAGLPGSPYKQYPRPLNKVLEVYERQLAART